MQVARANHSQSTLIDGRVLVCGGRVFRPVARGTDASAAPTGMSKVAEFFDPVTYEWSAAPPMRNARENHSQSTLADGRVLVSGGCHDADDKSSMSSAEIFDPYTSTWQAPTRKSSLTYIMGYFFPKPKRVPPSSAPILFNLKLPPALPTESMLQSEKAAALRGWLAKVEGIWLAAQQRGKAIREQAELEQASAVAKAHDDQEDAVVQAHRRQDAIGAHAHQMQETAIGIARTMFAKEVAAADEGYEASATRALATHDRALVSHELDALGIIEKEITRVRRQAEEAEQLSALLEGAAIAAPGAAGPAPARERPNEHICSITHDVMHDPVMIGCGDTFERAAITAWFQDHDTCPKCREPSNKAMIPNKAVKTMIQDW
jgi:hypothetical protein